MWVNLFGVPFRHVTVSDLLLVNGEGRTVRGRMRVNRAAFLVHSSVHRARPELIAVAHAHTTHGRALAAVGELLDPLTRAFYEDHALLNDSTGAAVDTEEGGRIAAAPDPHKGLVLRIYGLLTIGTTVDAAAWWFHRMERGCGSRPAARAAREAGTRPPRRGPRTPRSARQRPRGVGQLPATVCRNHPRRTGPAELRGASIRHNPLALTGS